MDKLASGPKPFRLMGEHIVLFLDGEGAPATLGPLPPPNREALQRLDDERANRMRLSRLGIRPDRTARTDSAPSLATTPCQTLASGPSTPRAATATPGSLPRRAGPRHSLLAARRRRDLSSHPPVRREVELRSQDDGEFFPQLPLLLRPQGGCSATSSSRSGKKYDLTETAYRFVPAWQCVSGWTRCSGGGGERLSSPNIDR